MKSLTIFYPAYNEQSYIKKAVEAAKEVGECMVREQEITEYEILIINDGSTDATAATAEELAGKDARVRVVHHQTNTGLGGAVRTGFTNSGNDIILYSDIDLPFDMMEVRKAFRLMRYYEADIVSAFRFDRTGEGLRRLIYSKLYNGLVRFLFNLRVKDVNFSFKLVRKEVFKRVELKSDGSFIDAELLIKAKRHGMKIIQFGTDYFPRTRGVSTLSSWPTIQKIIREMLQLRREMKSIESEGAAAEMPR